MIRTPEWLDTSLRTFCVMLCLFTIPFSLELLFYNPTSLTPIDFENKEISLFNALEPTKSKTVGMIAEKAVEHGIDPILALKVAFCESSYNPKAKNKQSSASGLFQITKKTFETYCSGNVFDAKDNLDCFLKLYPKHPTWWECNGL